MRDAHALARACEVRLRWTCPFERAIAGWCGR